MECGAQADARAAAEGEEGADAGPWLRLAGEAVGHEGGGIVPQLAMAMDDPRADPDLRLRCDLHARDLVGRDRLARQIGQARRELRPPGRPFKDRLDARLHFKFCRGAACGQRHQSD